MTSGDGEAAAARLLEHLAWEPVIDPAALARATGMTAQQVDAGVSRLAVSGKVGFDLGDGHWFHRELPLEDERVERDNPRLRDARRLVEEGAVRPDGERWVVTSGDHRQFVTRDGETYRCSCLWWAKYGGRRGACKHVLAVSLSLEANL